MTVMGRHQKKVTRRHVGMADHALAATKRRFYHNLTATCNFHSDEFNRGDAIDAVENGDMRPTRCWNVG